MSALIEFDSVCKYYQMGDTLVKAADHVSFQINKGEFVAIVGQSGSGKSTCMNIIGCLDVPTEGAYLLDGRDVGRMTRRELANIRNEKLGFIFQQYNLLPKLSLLENVEVTLVKAADHVSFQINKGEFVAIVGQSGSGKSTCMNIIGCLDVPTEGAYLLDGRDVGRMTRRELANIRNEKLGFIFQQYNLLPKLSLLENVEVPLVYAGIPAAQRHAKAKATLERVGLGTKLKNKPNQLSGGQQQRVSIARALAWDLAVILADEPTGALDSHTSREVLGMLQDLHKQGNTVVLITHDNSIAVQAERIIRLKDGCVVYDGDAHAPEAVVQPTLTFTKQEAAT